MVPGEQISGRLGREVPAAGLTCLPYTGLRRLKCHQTHKVAGNQAAGKQKVPQSVASARRPLLGNSNRRWTTGESQRNDATANRTIMPAVAGLEFKTDPIYGQSLDVVTMNEPSAAAPRVQSWTALRRRRQFRPARTDWAAVSDGWCVGGRGGRVTPLTAGRRPLSRPDCPPGPSVSHQ